MNKIYKYKLEITDNQAIEMFVDATILKIGFQNDELFVWVFVNIENNKTLRHFKIFGTGHECDCWVEQYRDTVFQSNGLVWHVFDNGQDI